MESSENMINGHRFNKQVVEKMRKSNKRWERVHIYIIVCFVSSANLFQFTLPMYPIFFICCI